MRTAFHQRPLSHETNLMGKCLASVMAVLLAVCMIPLAACSTQEAGAIELSAEATNVTYDASGRYTTTLTPASGVSMKDMNAEDIQVYSLVLVGQPVTESTEQTDAAADDAATASEEPADANATQEASSSGESATGDEGADDIPMTAIQAQVEEFTVADDGTATLTFVDAQATQNMPSSYMIACEANEFVSQVMVDYPVFTLTPDIEYVPADSTATKITLVLDDGEFAGDISTDDIALYGAFEGLTIESLSSAGKNLTLQLVGSLTMSADAGVYLDGSVGVAPRAIPHASEVTHVDIPIRSDGANFVQSELKVENGVATVPLNVYGIDDLSTVTPESITFADQSIKVQSVEVAAATRLNLAIEAPDADSVNAAAARLNGQEVTIGDLTFTANFPGASFWPVFDFVGDDGENLAITLIALAANGTFAESISADDVTLADGFEGGTVNSAERTGETTAEIKLTVPANGQTAETINLTGTVTLSAGALMNAWGEPTAEEASITRDYSQESLGRDITFIDVDGDVTTIATQELEKVSKLSQFVDMVGNSTFVKACSALGTIGSVASGAVGVMNVLTLAGVIPDANEELAKVVKEINTKIDGVHDIMMEQSSLMNRIAKTQYEDRVAGFNAKMDRLQNINETMQRYFTQAKNAVGLPAPDGAYLTMNRATAGPDNPFIGMTKAEQDKLYNARLIELMTSGDHPGGPFDGFLKTAETQLACFNDVAQAVTSRYDYSNAIYNYDYLCSLTYNFDDQALDYRLAFRSAITKELTTALADIQLRYDSANNPNNAQITQAQDNYNKVDAKLKSQTLPNNYNRPYVTFYLINQKVTRDFDLANQSHQAESGGIYDPSAKDAVKGYGNLSEAQQVEFVTRMNGRTLRDELAVAHFHGYDQPNVTYAFDENGHLDYGEKPADLKVLGLSLSQNHEWVHGRAGCFNQDLYKANYVPFDKSELVKDQLLVMVKDPGEDFFLKFQFKGRHIAVANGTAAQLAVYKG